ncbi:MAG: M3 family metallopeptidase [Bacteroidales bacterium]|nr:M3 family metallopeptidase [Bacteroidales bacterium]
MNTLKTAARLLGLAAFISMTACNNQPENIFLQDWNTPYGTAPFSKITTADYLPAFKAGIAEEKANIEAIIKNPDAPTFENTILAYENASPILDKVEGVFFNLSESDSTPEMQAIEEEVLPLLTEASNEILMNEALFARVKAVYDASESLTREQQMATKKLYQAFERNGVGLDEAGKKRFAEINTRLSSLSQKFGQNLLAENNAFKEATGITVSEYYDFMASCEDRAKREQVFKAYSARGNNGDEHDNNAIVLEILQLRAEMARLLGYPNFAAFQLSDKMAGTPETVDNFLQPIMDAAMRKAKAEKADMEKLSGHKIEAWDWSYYAEKVRAQKFALDESQTKPYFQADSVLKGVFTAAERIYGIKIEPAPEVEVYNPSVSAYKLTEPDGSLIGIFYRDYYVRPTKRGGAWMNNFRDAETGVRPIIVNVCNFPAPGEDPTEPQPSLLTIDNVQTAFHEFGHALHGFLTRCNYKSVSGTAVARDFVEMFSQFNENFAFVPEILSAYANNWETGAPIPEELVQKIGKALKFNQGFMTGELCAASILDMKWHELSSAQLAALKGPEDIRDFEQRVCAKMGLIDEIIPRYRTTYFNHIFNSGYSAGYYSYLWSEVLAADAWEKFKADGVFNKATAGSFRATFLEKGGSEEPMVLYKSFRGANPDPGALMRARGLESHRRG